MLCDSAGEQVRRELGRQGGPQRVPVGECANGDFEAVGVVQALLVDFRPLATASGRGDVLDDQREQPEDHADVERRGLPDGEQDQVQIFADGEYLQGWGEGEAEGEGGSAR